VAETDEVPRVDRLQIGVTEHARGRDAGLQCAERRRGRLDVRMRVDETWKQIPPFQVDLSYTGR
jgi:hypothetical protein